ncbi:MAG: rod shape-determining protein MreC [Paludibacteraceae bacterium]|nr:rod shape-determining protein MreC [Paludibacteraceae bacterium]
MNTLLQFIRKFSNLLLFLALEIVCLFLVARFNVYQGFQVNASCGSVIGGLNSVRTDVNQYFSLTEQNQMLAEQNSQLQGEIRRLESRLLQIENDTTYLKRKAFADENKFVFHTARVVSVRRDNFKNIITIDKGEADGIREYMGVISSNGVVGIVEGVTEHFSLVLPIINIDSKISSIIKGKNGTGLITWGGGDIRKADMEQVPNYVKVAVGDTVETSGHSTIFPAGISIGKVESFEKGNDDFYEITVRLSQDFSSLMYVDVIDFGYSDELKELNEQIKKGDNK